MSLGENPKNSPAHISVSGEIDYSYSNAGGFVDRHSMCSKGSALMTDLITTQATKLPATLEDLSKFVLVGRDKLQAVRAEISAMQNLNLAKEVRDQKLAEGQEIGKLVLLAEAKLGELFNQMPKATTNNPHGNNQFRSNSLREEIDPVESESAPVDAEPPQKPKPKLEIAADMGFNKNQVADFQLLADNPDAVQKAIVTAQDNGEIVTRSSALAAIQTAKRAEKAIRQEERRVENSAKVEQLKSPLDAQGLFQTIVIDPPWDWNDEGDVNQFGRAKPEYHTMPLDEIKNLPVSKIADENCHLYLWVTNRSLPKAFSLIDAWGFRYITCLTWVKPSIGMGNYFRGSTEQVLFAVKGSQPLKRHDVGTHFSASRGNVHSAKPDEFYALVESCSFAPFIDVFGRTERAGWTIWGENT